MSSFDKDDRGPEPASPSKTPRGTFGDARPDEFHDSRTGGSRPPEKVEDRPLVSKVHPEDYPGKDRKDGDLTR